MCKCGPNRPSLTQGYLGLRKQCHHLPCMYSTAQVAGGKALVRHQRFYCVFDEQSLDMYLGPPCNGMARLTITIKIHDGHMKRGLVGCQPTTAEDT